MDVVLRHLTYTSSTVSTQLNTGNGGTLTLYGGIANSGGAGQTIGAPIKLSAGSHVINSYNAETINIQGIVSNLTTAASIEKSGTGRLILSSANTFSGTTLVSNGNLQLNNRNALQSSTVNTGSSGSQFVTFKPTGTNTFGELEGADDLVVTWWLTALRSMEVPLEPARCGWVETMRATTYAGAISGDGSITKDGTGRREITGTNTYTGGTTVSKGNLAVNGSTSTTGTVSVVSGAILSGTGTVGGVTTINSGATHAPGNSSAGLESFSTDITYKTGSIFEWELNSLVSSRTGGTEVSVVGQTAGTGDRGGLGGTPATNDFDAVNVTGNATIKAGAIFKILLAGTYNRADPFWDARQVWSVFDVTGTKTTNFDTFHIYDTSGFVAASPTALNYTTGGNCPGLYTQISDGRIKEGRCMIAHVHEGTMISGFLSSLAPHGHRRTRSAAPWASGASASGTVSGFVYKDQGNCPRILWFPIRHRYLGC